MSEYCGTITEDGNAVCVPGSCSCSSSVKDNELVRLSSPAVNESEDGELPEIISIDKSQEPTLWQKIRSGVMFGIACIASPCCTPIIVPIVIALLAGTSAAIWLSAHIGWVYGGLTLLSIVSLVLGFRWMRQKSDSKRATNASSKTSTQPTQEIIHL